MAMADPGEAADTRPDPKMELVMTPAMPPAMRPMMVTGFIRTYGK